MRHLKTAKERTVATTRELCQGVTAIISDVRQRGDEALLRYNQQFDGCARSLLRVSREEIDAAYRQLSDQEVADMRSAQSNIRAFAKAQRASLQDLKAFSPQPGVTLGHRHIPVDACCCYVPGGNYPLYSSALMLLTPAKVAGVPRVAACSPAMKGTDTINPRTLVAMDTAGADEIYVVGGAQAIAAFAYGTAQIAPVDLIVGPGNSYVTEAKRQCYGQVGIDFLAGPSEVLVIADDTADPEVIAADLLAQSEHDTLAKGILLTTREALGRAVMAQVEAQLQRLDTADLAARSWGDYGEVILVDTLEEAAAISNQMAPEHLEIQVGDSEALVGLLRNYGALFVGNCAAEVFGDYAAGTNHTLPTLGAARYTGGVWVGTFLKTCTHQSMSRTAAGEMAPLVARMARGEGLSGHALAAEKRLEQ